LPVVPWTDCGSRPASSMLPVPGAGSCRAGSGSDTGLRFLLFDPDAEPPASCRALLKEVRPAGARRGRGCGPRGGGHGHKLHLLCPVRAIAYYVEHTATLRRTEQLFVCFGGGVTGKALSKKRLAGWLCEAIAHADKQAGRACPMGVRAHSTRAVAASTA